DPDIDFNGLGPAHALEPFVLEHAQQAHLHRRWDVADLVEEERPAVRQLEASFPLADRTGVRALLVPEQLTLQERLRQGGAIDGDQVARPFGGLVNRSGHFFLAGPRLSLDQDCGGAFGDAVDQLEYRAHRRAAANDVPMARSL